VPYADRADEWLVARCCESADEGAFAELVRRYRGPVFRLAVSVLGQAFAPEAEDVAQDVMLRVHQALHSFRGESRFGSWVYRIAFNRALNVKERVRYRAPHVSEQALAATASQDRGPHDQLDDERRRQAVLACVAELPEVYQSALRLHYWLGASVSEIAEMLDAPENTVKSYLHRARRLLHAQLAERGFDER
jgi:RNA polymerase sigma-70 factor (ECF subfamily)